MPITTETKGGFLPTSFPVVTDNPKELGVRLYQDLSFICKNINAKDSGYYPLTESVCGQLYFIDPALSSTSAKTPTWRGVYRKVIDFGTLPNAATKSVAHGITISNTFSFTRIYATASNPAGLVFFPIPGSGCDITVDATNVNISTAANKTAFTKCYAVLEFIKL
jgi:hypothetical protein